LKKKEKEIGASKKQVNQKHLLLRKNKRLLLYLLVLKPVQIFMKNYQELEMNRKIITKNLKINHNPNMQINKENGA